MSVLKVDRRRCGDGCPESMGDAVDGVAVELIESNPLPAIQLGAVEADAILVRTERTAVEKKQQLVALSVAWVSHPIERRAEVQARWRRPASCSKATLRGPRLLRSQLSTSCRLMAWWRICSGASCSASRTTRRASSRRLRAV